MIHSQNVNYIVFLSIIKIFSHNAQADDTPVRSNLLRFFMMNSNESLSTFLI